ncbi:NPP1 domain-containing protein [Fusarium pseudoanthophilum]|uniref:NPP1 domain-containing protein n=1 Tax=Fusarium pseudoanthophilum TaxID=48495 RepID=A0A8H5L242_9HYPO|nr:NPP1 domain-containing protein [Fusarium pseudoanthophilum]
MVLITQLLSGFALASGILASPIERRAVINHDAVVGFPQTVPSNTAGSLYLKYKPYLKVFNGCVPFPAVDSNGNTGYVKFIYPRTGADLVIRGGLATSGSSNGGCSSSTGQVYVRGGTYNGRYGIMYSWYMPKDSPSPGLGHRHDWENAVIWLSGESTSATVVGMAVSQHGGYDKRTSGTFSGNSPLVGYTAIWPTNHQMIFTNDKGGQQPLIAWESLTAAARTALTNTDFGSANVPFKDGSFESNLDKAAV